MKQIGMAEIKLTEQEIEAAVSVLKSGALRQGKHSDAFEQEFADKVGAKHAVTCANGSAALHLAYAALLNPGDEVLVPSFTFIATANMVTAMGGVPVICDVKADTFLIDLDNAAQKLTSKTRAIAPVHLFGNPADVDAVVAFANKYNLRIIWDAAQAHGTGYKGQDIGSFGDAVTYSFYPSKNMFVGEGGMICTDSADVARDLRNMRTHGQTGKYLHTALGFNYRLTDVEAAIGREQLKRLDTMLEIRRRNASLLNEGLRDVAGMQPQTVTEGGNSSWHQYCVVINEEAFGMNRDALAVQLKDNGIATGVHYPRGLHQQPIFEQLYGKQRLPVTEYLSNNILALPVHHGLTEDDVAYIIETICTIAK